MLYNNLSGYLRDTYGKRLKKICIDGGFSCPNRDGTVGIGGCIFCGERGAGEHIDPLSSITEQVKRGLTGGGADDFYIAYFQNFTNTYDTVSNLRAKYDSALIDERIKILSVGTRPDCITREIAEFLASYRDRVDVWVELGLQTASDTTAEIINRGYKTEVFLSAFELLCEYGIKTVVHMIIGLPGEGRVEILNTARLLDELCPFGVKIHSLYVMRGTALEALSISGGYTPLRKEEYVELAAECIARLDPSIVLHRITGDCPRNLLVAPEWNLDKNGVVAEISEYLASHGMRQGSKKGN